MDGTQQRFHRCGVAEGALEAVSIPRLRGLGLAVATVVGRYDPAEEGGVAASVWQIRNEHQDHQPAQPCSATTSRRRPRSLRRF